MLHLARLHKVASTEVGVIAFDLLDRDGEDLRDLPLIERKRETLARRKTGEQSKHRVSI